MAGGHYFETETATGTRGQPSFFSLGRWQVQSDSFFLSVMHRREETRSLKGGKWWWAVPRWKVRQALIPREFGLSSATYKLTESQ